MCVAALLLTIGCSSPTHPTTTARSSVEPLRTPITITYAINIPYADAAHALEAQHPDGVNLSPVQAQETFNFTDAYHGTPNVYYGPLAPPVGRYVFVGIVVAPRAVAERQQFLQREWPDGCGRQYPGDTVCAWLGRFAYAAPGS
jgi:hypothetical protein